MSSSVLEQVNAMRTLMDSRETQLLKVIKMNHTLSAQIRFMSARVFDINDSFHPRLQSQDQDTNSHTPQNAETTLTTLAAEDQETVPKTVPQKKVARADPLSSDRHGTPTSSSASKKKDKKREKGLKDKTTVSAENIDQEGSAGVTPTLLREGAARPAVCDVDTVTLKSLVQSLESSAEGTRLLLFH